MKGSWPNRLRRRIGIGVVALAGSWLLWTLSPGLPVLRAPRARAEVRQVGLNLFVHEWQPHDPLAHGDGLGPVFNARSCVACHFQGGVGGGGGPKENVLAFEAQPAPGHTDLRSGLIHKFAVDERFSERPHLLEALFPTVPKGLEVRGVCFTERRDFNPVRTQGLNSIALFGAGWIDRISAKTINHQRMRRSVSVIGKELSGDFGAISPGRPRILPDGRVGKFGWKAQFATLEEFVASACANEIGLGTHRMEQATPLSSGCKSPANPAVGPDLDKAQFRAMVAFVTTLPRPIEIGPTDPRERTQVDRGKALFEAVGCAACHTPDLGGVTGVYGDFLLHRIIDVRKNYAETPDIPPPAGHPLPEEWKTAPLWGVADSAPYFHDGSSPTLESAILRHEGDAGGVTEAYRKLPADDREAVIRFLKSLKAPADAEPAPAPTPAPAGSKVRGQLALAR
jgi:mono/diheme cytochrome c family protein